MKHKIICESIETRQVDLQSKTTDKNWWNKFWYIHMIEYYPSRKINEKVLLYEVLYVAT